jgi:LysR family hydrogen peroxide-inducible transcriptional activator
MTLNQLRYFIALGEEKNFTLAARRCAISQPSLTNAIRALEQELGGVLFHRRPRVRLTALGNALWPHFQLITHALDETPRIVAAMNGKSATTVMADTLGVPAMP